MLSDVKKKKKKRNVLINYLINVWIKPDEVLSVFARKHKKKLQFDLLSMSS